jgi:peptidoglycan-N-acetylmuramic acid deacetylase
MKKGIANKIIVLLSIILLLEIIVLVTNDQEQMMPVVNITYENWGLGYGEEGQQPTGNADKGFLKEYDAYFVGNDDEKILYLTFDAGYENGYTSTILDVLKKHEVKAAFFLVGHYFEENPELVKRMVEEGHIVGNHTMSHPDMSLINDINSFKKELEGIEDKYKEITGQDMPKYYRPPSGKYSESNLENAKSLGYTTVFWSLAYVDWDNNAQPSQEHAFSKLIPRTHPGAVVLLHNTSKTNMEILDELITRWKEDGYSFETLDHLSKNLE